MPGLARFEATPLARRLAFLYATLFVVVGCYLPYMPVWLHWRGLNEDAIAILLATPLFARILFTPAISFATDWSGARRTLLIFLAWGTLLSFLLLWASGGFWQMLLATLLVAFNWTTIMPLIEAVAVSGVRTAGLDYGRVRPWGSGSFILASVGAGLVIGEYGAASVLPMLVVATSLMIVGIHLLRRDVVEPGSGQCAAAAPHQPCRRRETGTLAILPLVSARGEPDPREPCAVLCFRHASLARARLRRRDHRRALGAWRRRRDRIIRGLWAHPRQMGCGKIAARRGPRRSTALGADGFRSAALGDDDVAMPARHELRRRASCGDVFPEPGRARGPRRLPPKGSTPQWSRVWFSGW
jgi:hypothetical protein